MINDSVKSFSLRCYKTPSFHMMLNFVFTFWIFKSGDLNTVQQPQSSWFSSLPGWPGRRGRDLVDQKIWLDCVHELRNLVLHPLSNRCTFKIKKRYIYINCIQKFQLQWLNLALWVASAWQISSISVMTLRWLPLNGDPNTDGTNSFCLHKTYFGIACSTVHLWTRHPLTIIHCQFAAVIIWDSNALTVLFAISPYMQFYLFAGFANVSEHRSPGIIWEYTSCAPLWFVFHLK